MMETKILGVLWTVGVEMQLYLIFPFVAKAFVKKPIITYVAMVLISLLSCYLISSIFYNINYSFWLNNTLTFFCVFANGMMGALIYVKLSKILSRKKYLEILFVIISIAMIFVFKAMCMSRMSYVHEQKWQIDFRYLLSFCFLAMILSTILASKWYRAIFNNKVMKFIAIISFNLYIYHQFIAVKLKEFKIPYWEGEELPNYTGNEEWKIKYVIICVVVTVLVATLTTYLIERPLSNRIKKLNKSKEV
jgi:peptidoglycan/LPS O-acetylase OafA/YrhL